MKTFLKIIAALLAILIVIGVGLNLYFTDERLKSTVMPYVNDAVQRDVEVESMSLTFFSTFPQPGLSINGMMIPGDTESDTLLSMDRLVASVKLFSLFGNQINISEISVQNPRFTYVINEDSTTNIDFLMETEEAPEDTTAGFTINIPQFNINGGNFGYLDKTSNTQAQFSDLNANISLLYSDVINSTVQMEVGGLSLSYDGTDYLNRLPIELSEQSKIDLKNETISLDEGTFSIRGLALDLSGSFSDWSNNLMANLTISSSSDNFGELLRLVPESYNEYVEGLETSGALSVDGSLKGALLADELPAFNLTLEVSDGYLKNPDLPKPIEDIQVLAHLDNTLLQIQKLNARAGENRFTANGELKNPTEDNGDFSFTADGSVNLATISQFYDISEFGIEQMSGQLTIDGEATGNRAKPKEAEFKGVARLQGGSLKYAEVPQAIENISFDINADPNAININSMSLKAAQNTFSMNGLVNYPMDEERRSIDLTTDLNFDLATIKQFYPIDEDTLTMRGILTANAQLKGQASKITESVQKGSIQLKNGFISHKSMENPIRDITLNSSLNGPTLTIATASFNTGNNNLSASGTITNYLDENRRVNLNMKGNADLSQIPEYYELEPTIKELTGSSNLDLSVSGSISDPANLQFDGQFTAKNINMSGEGLVQPVKNLNGELNLNPNTANLNALTFQIGSSDIQLNGSLKDYMEYLKEKSDRKTTPHLSGSYKSELLNLDELINWEDTTTAPIPINLPDLNSDVTADISKMIVTGVTMTDLHAEATTTPKQIKMEKASVKLFDGKATGAFTWDVPQPDHTMISFKGSLDSLQASAFFAEYPILGERSKFHEYVSGAFSADVDYFTEMNVYLDPLIETSTMDGNFGMTKARLQGHPLQQKVADLLSTKEFRNIALDKWESTYSLKNSILTINNLRLTSGDIGMELNGTQHLVKGDIDYSMKLFLPGRFKKGIASVITKQAADALTQENGTIMLPLRVAGTHENPQVQPDKEVISPILKKYLKGKAGSLIKNLFGNDR